MLVKTMLDPQALALIVVLIGMTAGGVWKLSRVESALRADINKSKNEIEDKQSQHSREFGETILAIRQKIADVELYASNEYMRRDGFYAVKSEIENGMRAMGERLEKRLERMETKLDSKT